MTKTLSIHFEPEQFRIGDLIQLDTGNGPEVHVITRIEEQIHEDGHAVIARVDMELLNEWDGKTRNGLDGTAQEVRQG